MCFMELQIACRKFRIKFSKSESTSGIDHCKDCAKQLSSFFTFKVVPIPNEEETGVSFIELFYMFPRDVSLSIKA